MKLIRLVLLMAVLAFIGAIAGCQEGQAVSKECLKAYEGNSAMYDYFGGLPQECLSD